MGQKMLHPWANCGTISPITVDAKESTEKAKILDTELHGGDTEKNSAMLCIYSVRSVQRFFSGLQVQAVAFAITPPVVFKWQEATQVDTMNKNQSPGINCMFGGLYVGWAAHIVKR